ncbi:MAG TPA: histidine phosphatase family protein [Nocardioides sp.]|uniref:SixA phosphatase family protein n=1 Tax=Nocardioides sp. TaxID=35761 RepID=UPI002B8FDF2A|nr:histidine phosphatase family protein [Nocardioides sp.]HTW16921.1 histidine phosphatase family protein [Nocardioides sp.]
MSEQTRTLVVMRHAKAEQDGATDFERRLAERGERDAHAAGAWLAGQGVAPDLALVSAAVRTHQTWESLAEGAGWDVELASYDESLYAAGPESALDVIREVDDAVRTLVVVGHNPTMAYLAQLLDDGDGDQDASAEMVAGYPTGATTVFAVEGDWSDLDEAGARVVAFHVGRG